MKIKGKETDLILDDWTVNTDEDCSKYWTQLCVKHARLVDRRGLDEIGSGICGVQGCEKEADYYYDFDEEGIRKDEYKKDTC